MNIIILLAIQYINEYHNFTRNSIYRPNAFIKAFGRNIEFRVKLSYVFNVVPYGI